MLEWNPRAQSFTSAKETAIELHPSLASPQSSCVRLPTADEEDTIHFEYPLGVAHSGLCSCIVYLV